MDLIDSQLGYVDFILTLKVISEIANHILNCQSMVFISFSFRFSDFGYSAIRLRILMALDDEFWIWDVGDKGTTIKLVRTILTHRARFRYVKSLVVEEKIISELTVNLVIFGMLLENAEEVALGLILECGYFGDSQKTG